jgi:hypothetical protein
MYVYYIAYYSKMSCTSLCAEKVCVQALLGVSGGQCTYSVRALGQVRGVSFGVDRYVLCCTVLYCV